jgi:hypothetical protein
LDDVLNHQDAEQALRQAQRAAQKGDGRSGVRVTRASEVVDERRLRVALAMIDASAERARRRRAVADVITRARLSREACYGSLANKRECMLLTHDLVAHEGLRRVEQAYRAAEAWPWRVEAAIERPGALRLSLVEIAAAGPAGIERLLPGALGEGSSPARPKTKPVLKAGLKARDARRKPGLLESVGNASLLNCLTGAVRCAIVAPVDRTRAKLRAAASIRMNAAGPSSTPAAQADHAHRRHRLRQGPGG